MRRTSVTRRIVAPPSGGAAGEAGTVRIARPAVVATALAATLLAGVAVAGVAARTPDAPGVTAADSAVLPSPIDQPSSEPLAEAADRSRAAAPAPKVAPLAGLRVPDLLVTVRRPLTPAQVAAVKAVRKVEAVTVVDSGSVKLAGKSARILGVDPSQFRGFTPKETASCDALWQSVARGEIAPTPGL